MNKAKLIIQRTLNGLNTEFKSEGINESDLDKLGILYDERKELIQIASLKLSFSVSIYNDKKVISLINLDNRDIEGRAGFYAIRLIVDKGAIITGLYNLFTKIATSYVGYIRQGSLNNQNYSELLDEVDANTQISKVIVSPNVTDKVCYKIVDNSSLDAQINDVNLELVRKTYLFDQSYAIDLALLKTRGFIDFELLKTNVRHIHINNPDGMLMGLSVNNKKINSSQLSRQESIDVYVLNTDKVQYQDYQGGYKDIIGNSLMLRKPELPKQRPLSDSEYHPRSSRKKSSSGAVVVGIFCLILGAAGGYFIPKYFFASKASAAIVDPIYNIVNPNKTFDLKLVADKSESFVLESTNHLTEYLFKYDSKTKSWKVRGREEDAKKDKELTEVELKKILGDDSIYSGIFLEKLKPFASVDLKKTESSTGNKLVEANTDDNKNLDVNSKNTTPITKSSTTSKGSNQSVTKESKQNIDQSSKSSDPKKEKGNGADGGVKP